jgi:hypothetical protein
MAYVSNINWTHIRNDYVNAGLNLRELSDKYGVSLKSIGERCKREHWVDKKREINRKIERKIERKVEQTTINGRQYIEATWDDSMRLLYNKALELAQKSNNSDDLNKLAQVMAKVKSMSGVMTKEEADAHREKLNEMRARIDSLKSQTEESKDIRIEISGGEEWAE